MGKSSVIDDLLKQAGVPQAAKKKKKEAQTKYAPNPVTGTTPSGNVTTKYATPDWLKSMMAAQTFAKAPYASPYAYDIMSATGGKSILGSEDPRMKQYIGQVKALESKADRIAEATRVSNDVGLRAVTGDFGKTANSKPYKDMTPAEKETYARVHIPATIDTVSNEAWQPTPRQAFAGTQAAHKVTPVKDNRSTAQKVAEKMYNPIGAKGGYMMSPDEYKNIFASDMPTKDKAILAGLGVAEATNLGNIMRIFNMINGYEGALQKTSLESGGLVTKGADAVRGYYAGKNGTSEERIAKAKAAREAGTLAPSRSFAENQFEGLKPKLAIPGELAETGLANWLITTAGIGSTLYDQSNLDRVFGEESQFADRLLKNTDEQLLKAADLADIYGSGEIRDRVFADPYNQYATDAEKARRAWVAGGADMLQLSNMPGLGSGGAVKNISGEVGEKAVKEGVEAAVEAGVDVASRQSRNAAKYADEMLRASGGLKGVSEDAAQVAANAALKNNRAVFNRGVDVLGGTVKVADKSDGAAKGATRLLTPEEQTAALKAVRRRLAKTSGKKTAEAFEAVVARTQNPKDIEHLLNNLSDTKGSAAVKDAAKMAKKYGMSPEEVLRAPVDTIADQSAKGQVVQKIVERAARRNNKNFGLLGLDVPFVYESPRIGRTGAKLLDNIAEFDPGVRKAIKGGAKELEDLPRFGSAAEFWRANPLRRENAYGGVDLGRIGKRIQQNQMGIASAGERTARQAASHNARINEEIGKAGSAQNEMKVIKWVDTPTLKDPKASPIVKDDYLIITAADPIDPAVGKSVPLDQYKNAQLNAAMVEQLKREGFEVLPAKGVWEGQASDSYIIPDVDEETAAALLKRFNQEAGVTRKGGLYSDGTISPAKGGVNLNPDPAGGYTELPDGTRFGLDIDWELDPAKRVPITKAPRTANIPIVGTKPLMQTPAAAPFGLGAGISQDDEGKTKYDAGKGLLGMLGMAAGLSPQAKRAGKGFSEFFSKATKGITGVSEVPWEPVDQVDDLMDVASAYTKHENGNFTNHIARSIPTFRENQMRKLKAIVDAFGGENVEMLDIAGSEGGLAKTITDLSGGRIKTTIVDPNADMHMAYENTTKVPESRYIEAGFGLTEDYVDDETGEVIKAWKPDRKFDLVHESMGFQFFSDDRARDLDDIKAVTKPNGVVFLEEKFVDTSDAAGYQAREAAKDSYKAKYFTPEELAEKDKEVGLTGVHEVEGMVGNQADIKPFEEELRKRFKYVEQYWDAGNFKGFVASDDPNRVSRFMSSYGGKRVWDGADGVNVERSTLGEAKKAALRSDEGAVTIPSWLRATGTPEEPNAIFTRSNRRLDTFINENSGGTEFIDQDSGLGIFEDADSPNKFYVFDVSSGDVIGGANSMAEASQLLDYNALTRSGSTTVRQMPSVVGGGETAPPRIRLSGDFTPATPEPGTTIGEQLDDLGYDSGIFLSDLTPNDLASKRYLDPGEFPEIEPDITELEGIPEIPRGQTLYRYANAGYDELNRMGDTSDQYSLSQPIRTRTLQYFDEGDKAWHNVVQDNHLERVLERGKGSIGRFHETAKQQLAEGEIPPAYERAYMRRAVTDSDGNPMTVEEMIAANDEVGRTGSLEPYRGMFLAGRNGAIDPDEWTHLGDGVFLKEQPTYGDTTTEVDVIAPQIFGTMNTEVDPGEKTIHIGWLGAGAADMDGVQTGEVGLGVNSMLSHAFASLRNRFPNFTMTTSPGSPMVNRTYQGMGFNRMAGIDGGGTTDSLYYPLGNGRAFAGAPIAAVGAGAAANEDENGEVNPWLVGAGVLAAGLAGRKVFKELTQNIPFEKVAALAQKHYAAGIDKATGNFIPARAVYAANMNRPRGMKPLLEADGTTLTKSGRQFLQVLEDQNTLAKGSSTSAVEKGLNLNYRQGYQPARTPDPERVRRANKMAELLYGERARGYKAPARGQAEALAESRNNIYGLIDSAEGAFQQDKRYPTPAVRLQAGIQTETNPYKEFERVATEQGVLKTQEDYLRRMAGSLGTRVSPEQAEKVPNELLVRLQDGTYYRMPNGDVAQQVKNMATNRNIIGKNAGIEDPRAAWLTSPLEWAGSIATPLMTVARPAFTGVNVLGNVSLMGRAGYGRKMPEASMLQAKLMKAGGVVDDVEDPIAKAILKLAEQNGVISALDLNPQTVFDPSHRSPLFRMPVAGEAMAINQRINAVAENNARLTVFLQEMERNGGNPSAARQRVDDVMFNYDVSALTPAEQELRKLMPFYTFTRRNAPATAEYFARHPQRLPDYANIQTEMSDRDPVTGETQDFAALKRNQPEWMQDQIVSQRGDDLYNFRLPETEVFNMGLIGENMAEGALKMAATRGNIGLEQFTEGAMEYPRDLLSPVYQTGLNLFQGYNEFGQKPQANKLYKDIPFVGTAGGAIAREGKEEIKGGDPKAIPRFLNNFLSPFPNYAYNPMATQYQRTYKQNELMDEVTKYAQESGIPVAEEAPMQRDWKTQEATRVFRLEQEADKNRQAAIDTNKINHILTNYELATSGVNKRLRPVSLTPTQQQILRAQYPEVYDWWRSGGSKEPSALGVPSNSPILDMLKAAGL